MAGYSLPTYDAVDNTVGLYRRYVTVPAAWAGRRVYWHFDGAFDGAEVFVNGQKAGYHESGYTAWDIDLTGLVKPGQRNLFAVRVSKTTPSDDCETGDFQAMGGIYRDTSLIAVPQTHVDDITCGRRWPRTTKTRPWSRQLSVKGTPGQTVAVAGKLMHGDGRPTGVTLAGQGRIRGGRDRAGRDERPGESARPLVGGEAEPLLRRLLADQRRQARRTGRAAVRVQADRDQEQRRPVERDAHQMHRHLPA